MTPHGLAAMAVAASPAALLTVALQARGHTPDPWQIKALESRAPRLAICAARQLGKSSVVAVRALWEAAYRPRSLALVVSASETQARELLARVGELLPVVGEHASGLEESRRELRFANGSRIAALPSSSRAVRGYSAHLLILDEGAFLPDASYYSATATTTATGGALLATSSAGFPAGWFYSAMTDPRQGFERITVTAYDVSRISAETIEAKRRSMTDDAFRREYLSEFVGAAGSVFEGHLIETAFAEGRGSGTGHTAPSRFIPGEGVF